MSINRELSQGAIVRADGSVRFRLWAPEARAVSLLTGENHRTTLPLERRGEYFELVTQELGAGGRYMIALDDGEPRPDPASRFQPEGVHGPSEVVDPSAFHWSDASWRGVRRADVIIYELHVGTFTPSSDFRGVIAELPRLRDLGITAVELMPIAEFPGRRNWGYDGVCLYSPHHAYGGPAGLQELVNAAHAHGLAVILDVVYNHLGPEGNYLHEFGPYFTERYKTPWGKAVNFDGPGSTAVRRYFIDNALSWIVDYHIDGLRLDACHEIYDRSPLHILEELTDAVHEAAARVGRAALIIAENDRNDPRLTRAVDRGGFGLDGQWNDDFHHSLHTLLTGEQAGYYRDYGSPGEIAKLLRDSYVYTGSYSRFRKHEHGRAAADVDPTHCVVGLQNHDQVGNRPKGERLRTLTEPDRLRLATVLMMLSPFTPLLFMGEEYGETRPFLYFVEHGDPQLVEAVREGRRNEFPDLFRDGEFHDPQSAETFERSFLAEPFERITPLTALYRDLISIRRSYQLPVRAARRLFYVDLLDTAGRMRLTYDKLSSALDESPKLILLLNFSDAEWHYRLDGRYRPVLESNNERYGGTSSAARLLDEDGRRATLDRWSGCAITPVEEGGP